MKGKGRVRKKSGGKRIPKNISAYAPFRIGCAENPRPRFDIPPLRRIFQFDHDITQNPQIVNCSNILNSKFNTDRYTSVIIHTVRVWTQGAYNQLQEMAINVVVPSDRPDPASNYADYAGKPGECAKVGVAIPHSLLSQYKKSETFLKVQTSTCTRVLVEVDATIM